jgi:hypothetical protein
MGLQTTFCQHTSVSLLMSQGTCFMISSQILAYRSPIASSFEPILLGGA